MAPRNTVKRKASPGLTGRPSPYHTSVTLCEAPESTSSSSETQPTLRRSKRVKVKPEPSDISTADPTQPLPASEDDADAFTLVAVKAELEEATVTDSAPACKPRKNASLSPRKTKTKPVPQSLAVPHPAPARWEEAYARIKHMRESIVAPVDTMGCEQAQLKEADPRVRRVFLIPSLQPTCNLNHRCVCYCRTSGSRR